MSNVYEYLINYIMIVSRFVRGNLQFFLLILGVMVEVGSFDNGEEQRFEDFGGNRVSEGVREGNGIEKRIFSVFMRKEKIGDNKWIGVGKIEIFFQRFGRFLM